MFEFQPDKVHPELVARSKEMLLDIDVAKVQAVGPAAITFYVWVRTTFYVWVRTVAYVRLMHAVFSYLYYYSSILVEARCLCRFNVGD